MDVKKPPTWTMDANVNKVTGEFKRAASQFRRSVTGGLIVSVMLTIKVVLSDSRRVPS